MSWFRYAYADRSAGQAALNFHTDHRLCRFEMQLVSHAPMQASSDIYYLEICMYSMLCKNRAALFNLKVNEEWECDMDADGFNLLRDWVLNGLA